MPLTPRHEAAVYSTLAADGIARAVEAAYQTGPVASCWLARRGFNDVYELRLATGARCIARLSGVRARGDANIAYEAAMLLHLKKAGAAVAAPWLARNGDTSVVLQAVEGARTLAVFEFLEGEPPSEKLADIEATGAGLAQLHVLARDYAGPQSLYDLNLNHLLMRPLGFLLQAPTMDDGLRSEFSDIAAALERRIAGMASLTEVACHGDCHGGNNFMTDGPGGTRVASFFDFDDAGPGYLAYDLAVYLWSGMFGKTEPDAAVRERWKHYLAGYEAITTVPAADMAAITAFVCVRHFWYVGEHASRLAQQGAQSLPRAWLQKQVALLKAWQALEAP